MPDLRQLRAFVAVAEERNFTHAARRLHLAQQAVSKTVAQLEAELGVPLLERTTRDVRLTAAGAALLRSGRALLAAAEDAFSEAQDVGHGRAGTVRVGVSPAVGPLDRAAVTRALRERAPEVALVVREVRPGEMVALLRDRTLDLALARTAPADAPDVEHAALRSSPAELLVPTGHRLAAAGEPVLPAELDGERLLTHNPPGTPYTDALLSVLGAAGASVQPVESPIIGGNAPPELIDGAVAVVPAGWPTDERAVRLALAPEVVLPLLVLWPAGSPSAAVLDVRAALGPA